MAEEWSEILKFAENLTTRGILLLVIVGLIRGWLVPGHIYRQAIAGGEHWRTIALRVTRLAEKGAGLPSVDEQLDELMRRGGTDGT